MLLLSVACAVSFIITLWVVHSSDRHGHVSRDHDVSGPQKFHARPVPRIGGLGIFVGAMAGIGIMWAEGREQVWPAFLLWLAAIPAFASGFVEDLTKRISPRRRLFFTAMSAALAVLLVDALIDRADLPGFDWLLAKPALAIGMTIFVVAGVANAVNIIDGFNGLASMCGVLMLSSLAYVGFQVGDPLVSALALIGIGAVAGFFIWNFPAGLIFLGDGGAYFLGFWVAELSILLTHRNPQVSPLFPLLVCIYPVFETLFSMYRRKLLRGQPVGMPDGVHLHSLIYRRFLRWAAGERTAKELTRRNSMTSPYLWMLCMCSVVPATLWWYSTPVMLSFILVFAAIYLNLYWRIVRFRAPRVLRRLSGSRPVPLDEADNRAK